MLRSALAILGLFAGVIFVPTLYAQTLDPNAAAQAGSHGHSFEDSAAFAFLISSALEWMKRSQRFPWLTEDATWGVQRVLGVLLAIATTLGIQYQYDATAGTLLVSGLTWPSLAGFGWDAFKQFFAQEIIYRAGVKPYRRGVMY